MSSVYDLLSKEEIEMIAKRWIKENGVWFVPSTMILQSTGYFISHEKMEEKT